MDRSDEIYDFQTNFRANVVQKLRANVENLRETVVVVVVAGVGGVAEPLNFVSFRPRFSITIRGSGCRYRGHAQTNTLPSSQLDLLA